MAVVYGTGIQVGSQVSRSCLGRGWTGDEEYQVVSMLCLSVKCHAMGCIPIYLFIELMKVSRYGFVCLMPELSPQLFP